MSIFSIPHTWKKVGVVGLGARTGVSLVRYLCSKGMDVTVYDVRTPSELFENLQLLSDCSFSLEVGTPNPSRLFSADLWIVSPGVPLDQPYIQKAKSLHIPLWSEIEFASQRLSCPLMAVTGSNGKSTTTALLGHILGGCFKNVFTGGNLGIPLVEALERPLDVAVVEVSSFQLETIETFHPTIGILTNLSPNHLDRHKTMETYVRCKEKMFSNMNRRDRAILFQDHGRCQEIQKRISVPCWTFSGNLDSDASIVVRDKHIHFPEGRKISLDHFPLFGKHNIENAMAASAAALAFGCPEKIIEERIQTFQSLPHRLQSVGNFQGVQYVNDSKSTTPESTARAVHSFSSPIILIAGGRPKKVRFEDLAQQIQGKVKKVFLLGEAAQEMSLAFSSIPHETVKDLSEAFHQAQKIKVVGDVVLFSPANTSFDQYKNFEERGEHFLTLVREQAGKHA